MLKLTRRGALTAAGTLIAGALPRKRAAAEDLLPLDLQALRHGPPGPALPDFEFTTASGEKRTLADYKGQGVVLNFWATWCGPCIKEMPALDQLARTLRGDNIAVLPLSSDRGGASVVEKYYKDNGIANLPVLLDKSGDAARAIHARGLPTTVILDADGRERQRVEGAVEWARSDVVAALRASVGRSAG